MMGEHAKYSMHEKTKVSDKVEVALVANANNAAKIGVSGRYDLVCLDKDGNEKWRDVIENIIVNEGLNHVLASVLDGATQITTWYCGLKGTGTAVAADTLASHGSWSELAGGGTVYSGTRPAITFGTTASQSLSSSAVSFSITGSATVAGAFVCSVASGTSGTLFSAGDNTGGNRAVVNTDTLLVTLTFTAADA